MRNRLAFVGIPLAFMVLGLGFEQPSASIVKEEPTDRQPVVAGAALRPAKIQPGGTMTIVVQVKIAPTWHIYAADADQGTSIPTTLKLKLPKGIAAKGEWSYPQATKSRDVEGSIYEGELTFRRTLNVASDVSTGPLEVACEFGYQACDPFMCRPPAKLALKAKAEIVKSP
jgi:DsbC/DsbD-like thiol-disulfide interchange protein